MPALTAAFVPDGLVILAVDDTIERRRDAKMEGGGFMQGTDLHGFMNRLAALGRFSPVVPALSLAGLTCERFFKMTGRAARRP